MSVSIAEGALWAQRARFFLAPLTRPVVALRRVAGRLEDGSECSVLTAGDGPIQRTLLAALLPHERREEPLGRASLPRLPALLRREAPRHDLVLALVPQVVAGLGPSWSGCLRLPEVVDMRVPAEEVRRRRKLGRGTVATAYRRWRQQRFAAVLTRDAASLDRFYETMYLPFARGRFGEAAFVRDRRSMRRTLDRGGVLWIEQDGLRVAGRLVMWDDEGTLHAMSLGTGLDPDVAESSGVIAATTLGAIEYACEAGLRWIDLGGCMPWLTDGVLLNKRRWGAELTHRRWLHKVLLASWERWTPAAAALLAMAPIHRTETALLAVTTPSPSRKIPVADLRLPGLGDLRVVADPAAAESAGEGEIRPLRPGGSRELLAQMNA